jgi:DNA repair photolyase
VYTETAGQVERELCCRQHRPRAVFISPSTDPFPAAPLVQAEAVRVVEVVAQQGIEAWLMTRGVIQSAALEVLTAHRNFVKVTVGLTTLDEQLQQTLEPLASTPSRRLQQLAELRRRGVAVQASIEPLLPGLTDTRANLVPLLKALASVGVLHVTTSYMFLRPRIQDHLTRRLTEQGYDRTILEAYAGGPFLDSGGLAAARYLPKVQRQRGYAAVMALAAGFAMTVTVCRVTNPDFPAARRPYNIRRAAGLVPAAQETSEHRGELLHDLVTTRTGSVGFPKLG